MAVQFIVGRSGTGKSSFCIKAIVEALAQPGSPAADLIFLVPEQATYQAERAILSDRRISGYSRLQVLSFERLGFLLSGKKAVQKTLSRVGQEMIIRRILAQNQEKLKVFGASVESAGLAGKITQSIVELQQYAKAPEDVDELVAGVAGADSESLTALKFADIALIYREYLKFIEGRYTSADIQLSKAKEEVVKAGFIRGAKLWVDGFSGFTASELEVLAELLKTASEAKIALCLDPRKVDLVNGDKGKLDGASLFYPTERTYAELVEIIKKCKLSIAEPVVLDEPLRFGDSPALRHIERNLFEVPAGKIGRDDGVRIVSAQNARAEVEFVAREIVGLVKQRRFRYRDIAVVASDIGVYQHYVEACFKDYGIPFFIDRRRPMKQHPLVELVCSGLRVVGEGWRRSDIFGFLKSELGPMGRYEVDILENYCLAVGIPAEDWGRENDWRFGGKAKKNGFDEQRINEVRRKAVGVLLELEERLGGAEKTITAGELVRAVWELLERLGVRQRLSEWIEEAIGQGKAERADEHRQVFDQCVNLFDELVEIFGAEVMTARQWLSILEGGFSQMSLAFIPPKLDQVLVGSIERSRHPELKAVFLVGASQKQFPVPVSFESILTDDDRCAAEQQGFSLADTAEQQLAARQYLAYIAFTRPRRVLYVTYPLADEASNGLCASEFVASLKELFEDFPEEFYRLQRHKLEEVRSKIELSDLLCIKLGKDAEQMPERQIDELGALLAEICGEPELTCVGNMVCDAINYDNAARLNDDFVRSYFGDRLQTSATRLSAFAACPYKHFARHILGLKKREIFRFEPLDLGIFYHLVLQRLFERLKTAGKDFASAADEELLRSLKAEIAALLSSEGFYANFARRSAANDYIINSAGEVLEDFVIALAKMVRAGRFRPIAAEVTFGEDSDLGMYKLKLTNNRVLYLDGKIDRLDVAQVAGTDAAVVFDYKRTDRNVGWSELYHGLDLQLTVYLLAIQGKAIGGANNLRAAGAFYIPIEVSSEPASINELEGMAGKVRYKAKGLFDGEFFKELDDKAGSGWSRLYNFCVSKEGGQYGHYNSSGALRPEDFEKVLAFSEKKIRQLAEETFSGRIEVVPFRLNRKSPCGYCDYRAVCRFDWQINEYRPLESVGKGEVLEMIRGRAGE